MSKSFTALAPVPLVSIDPDPPGVSGVVNFTGYTPVAFHLTHGAITAGIGAAAFEVGRKLGSTSGGVADIAAVDADGLGVTINNVVGVFAPGDTITQTNGPNNGANAIQIGAPDPLTFEEGETLSSSGGGSATISTPSTPDSSAIIGVTGLFADTNVLTQTTGINAGATATQDGNLVNFTFGPFCVRGFLNGRLRGIAHQDVIGTMLIEFGPTPVNMTTRFEVTQDTDQSDFQYPFDVIVLAPFVRLSFTNGGAAATFFRANAQVLPI